MMLEPAFFLSPLGPIEITGSDEGIASISFKENTPTHTTIAASLTLAISQLTEYFSGKRKEFSLPLAPEGTPFQKQVWQELQAIPFGEKRSYLDIAIKLGDKNLTRAVGAANGKNPIAIIIPCHRVVGENGALTGYAGGLWRKEWLLNFESPSKQEQLF
ncbi:MAG: methylated-DNA--[protein]-cysteine S-methyltransferase [Candidatus Kapaibacterium sp.]